MTETLARVMRIYTGSDGDATRALYEELSGTGEAGRVAVDVLRAQKASERAKKYRGGFGGTSYRTMAYERKQWAINNVAQALNTRAARLGITWGWGLDLKSIGFEHVLYVELPTGQVSWHTTARGPGPDFPKPWDGVTGVGPQRICTWAAGLLDKVEA